MLNWHLALIGQKNRTRSGFNSKAALPLQGGLFPSLVEIVRRGFARYPLLNAKPYPTANAGMEKSTGPAWALNIRNKSGSV